jgi:hypothetical protein
MRALVILFLVPAVARADLARERFRSARAIDVGGKTGLVRAALPTGVYPGAQGDLSDLRVVDDRDREVPYVVQVTTAGTRASLVESDVQDHVGTPDGVQFVLDTGEGRRRHSRVQLSTPDRDFRRPVRVEGSLDQTTWATLRDRAWVFDFSQEPGRHAELLEVDYVPSTMRFVRVTIGNEGGPPLRVTRAAVLLFESADEERHVAWTGAPHPEPRDASRRTVFEIDLARPGIPQGAIDFETSARDFHRAVWIETRARDDGDWEPSGNGVVYRIDVDGVTDERLQVRFSEVRGRWLRVTIDDRDDPPLPISRVTVRGQRRDLLFRAEAERSYRLLYGHAEARAPSYELALVLARQSRLDPAAATIGPWSKNAAYRPPPPPTRPLTDRYPVLFYALLVGAVVVLGVFTVRLMKKASAESA